MGHEAFPHPNTSIGSTVPARVYMDAAAAAPLHPVAKEALVAALADGWADPAKLYTEGRRAAQLLDAARAVIADHLTVRATPDGDPARAGTRSAPDPVRPDEITFCAGGSRAIALAIAGARAGRARIGDIVVHSAIEHSAVLRAAGTGGSVPVPVDRWGSVDLDLWAAAVAEPGVAVAALIAASHEVGTAQPVDLAAAACAGSGVPLLVDAAQCLGRVAPPRSWSLLTASAAKWGGPAGVGILAVRKGVRWAKPWPIERPDPDPVSLPLVVAAAASLRAVAATMAAEQARLSRLVDRIRARVATDVPDVEVVGDPTVRLPHIVTFSCLYVDGEALLSALDRHGFAVSSGSSCTASTLRPSHVLEAMGVLSHGNVRVSLHPGVTAADVERFLDVLPRVVADLRAEAGVTGL